MSRASRIVSAPAKAPENKRKTRTRLTLWKFAGLSGGGRRIRNQEIPEAASADLNGDRSPFWIPRHPGGLFPGQAGPNSLPKSGAGGSEQFNFYSPNRAIEG